MTHVLTVAVAVGASVLAGGGAASAAPARLAGIQLSHVYCKIPPLEGGCGSPDYVKANAAHQIRVCAEGGAISDARIVAFDRNTGRTVKQFTTYRKRCEVVSGLYGYYAMRVTGGGDGYIQDY